MFGKLKQLKEQVDDLRNDVRSLQRALENRRAFERTQHKINSALAYEVGGYISSPEFVDHFQFISTRTGHLFQQVDSIAEWLDIKFEKVERIPQHLRAVYALDEDEE